MNSILVPIDFSQASLDAFLYAVSIGEMFHSRVTLLHVLNSEHVQDPMEIEKAMRQYETKIPRAFASRIEVVHRISLGDPVREIATFSELYEVSLLVMGMKASNDNKQFLMGDIIAQVLRKSDLPILIIPEGLKYKQISEIAYATDFQEDEFKAIDALLDISFLYHATIHCIHIQKAVSATVPFLERQAVFEQRYQGDVLLHKLKFVLQEESDMATGILDYCENEEIDTLAMISSNRSVWTKFFQQHTSRKMIIKAAIPLLIFDAND